LDGTSTAALQWPRRRDEGAVGGGPGGVGKGLAPAEEAVRPALFGPDGARDSGFASVTSVESSGAGSTVDLNAAVINQVVAELDSGLGWAGSSDDRSHG
jgi:hypothetical protein